MMTPSAPQWRSEHSRGLPTAAVAPASLFSCESKRVGDIPQEKHTTHCVQIPTKMIARSADNTAVQAGDAALEATNNAHVRL
jgi:hypothetical protein